MARTHFGGLLAFLLATSLLSACSSGSDSEAPGGGAGANGGSGATGAGGGEAPTTGWAKSFDAHSLFTDQGPAVAVDGSGNIYLTGSLNGPTGSFGGDPLTRATENHDDVFVASFTPSGEHRWSRRFGSDYGDNGQAIAVDATGNVIVAGFLSQEAVDFGGGPLTRRGAFVASLTSDGEHRWSRAFGEPASYSKAWGVAVDETGDVYVTGTFWGALDFGGGTLVGNGATFDKGDAYVASYDANGTFRWAKQFGDEEAAAGRAIAAGAGFVVAGGGFRGTVDFGGGPVTAMPDTDAGVAVGDAFVALLASNGDHVWSAGFGSPAAEDDEQVRAAAIDASGNVLVAGTMGRIGGGPVDFGGGPIGGGGYGDAFAASFTSSGAHRWSKAAGHPGVTGEFGAAVDDAGNFYVAGAFDRGRYVASFGPDGSERWWGKAATGSGDHYLYAFAVAVDPSSGVDETGHFTGTVDFGGTSLTSTDAQEIFLVQLVQP